MTPAAYDVVIVGGGHAGAQAAITLRQEKFTGTIAIIGEELELPYERPPLSKEYLAGGKPFGRILIRPEAFWTEREVTMRLGERVLTVDPNSRHVRTDTGIDISYEHLVWAAGGSPRRLSCPGHNLVGVHSVRSRADVDRLRSELAAARDIVVVGGGYIGLEAAAALTYFGKSLTIVEAQDRVLARVAGKALSRFFEEEHRAHGVNVLLGATVDCLLGDRAVRGVRLADGTEMAAQIVIVGIGIIPAIAPLADAGAATGNGLIVDSRCRTSLPGVYAIGDCASHANGFADGEMVRLESVQNANDQATIAARTIAGREALYDAVPWFWSNQYDVKLQTVGLSAHHDAVVLRGDPANKSFSVIYLKGGRVVALDCVNAVRDYVQGRTLVTSRAAVDPALLADASVPLKAMVRN